MGAMANEKSNGLSAKRKIDLGTLAGLLVAIGGILGGLILEGGRFSDVAQYTAALDRRCGHSRRGDGHHSTRFARLLPTAPETCVI